MLTQITLPHEYNHRRLKALAEEHWAEHLPIWWARMSKEGTTDKVLDVAAATTRAQIRGLMGAGAEHWEAWEEAATSWIYLPGEADTLPTMEPLQERVLDVLMEVAQAKQVFDGLINGTVEYEDLPELMPTGLPAVENKPNSMPT